MNTLEKVTQRKQELEALEQIIERIADVKRWWSNDENNPIKGYEHYHTTVDAVLKLIDKEFLK